MSRYTHIYVKPRALQRPAQGSVARRGAARAEDLVMQLIPLYYYTTNNNSNHNDEHSIFATSG